MEINFFFEEIEEQDFDFAKIKRWIVANLKKYNKKAGDINYIYCSDTYLLEINKKYLKHDYYTDIITFDYSVDNIVSGDIYISVDRVKENAKVFNSVGDREFLRVMIHGILHLVGLNDGTKDEKKEMRDAENTCLNEYFTM